MREKGKVLSNGGTWERATHIETCEEYPWWVRPYHLEMPVLDEDISELFDYPQSGELAFCLPVGLFHRGDNRFHRFEGYIKAAFLLARNMTRFWDVAEQGVPIFIGVSANGREIFEGYRQRCNFPESHIIELPSMEKYPKRFTSGWNIKLELLFSEELSRFKRRVHVDTSLYLRGPNDKVCSRMIEWWHTPEVQGYAIPAQARATRNVPVEDVLTKPREQSSVEKGFVHSGKPDNYWHMLAEVVGTTAAFEEAYWLAETFEHVPGYFVGISQSFWEDPKMRSLYTQLTPQFTTDECVFSVMLREWGVTSENTLTHMARQVHLENWRASNTAPLSYMPVFPSSKEEALMQWWREEHGYAHRF